MNVALPAVIFAIVLLPGVIFTHVYRLDQGDQSFTTYSRLTAFSIIASALIHLVMVALFDIINYPVNFTAIFDLISGKEVSQKTIDTFTANKYYVFLYFFACFSLAYLSGRVLKKWVLSACIDIYFPAISLGSELYTIFKCRRVGALSILQNKETANALYVVCDCLVNVDGKTVIYKGIVDRFHESRDGKLDNIVLIAAKQRDYADHGKGFKRISSDYFYLKYDNVINFNLRYKYIDENGQIRTLINHQQQLFMS